MIRPFTRIHRKNAICFTVYSAYHEKVYIINMRYGSSFARERISSINRLLAMGRPDLSL